MVITLPIESIAELTHTLVSQKPATADNPGQWLGALRVWRAVLTGAAPDVRAHMGTQIDIFDHALSFIPTLDTRTGTSRPRAGDWDTLEKFPELRQEQQAWLEAGLLPEPTISSSEWPAVALLHACHQANQTPGALEFYVRNAYLHDAPSVMRQLLPWLDQLDLVEMMHMPAHGLASNPPIGFRLFSKETQRVRPVLLPYLPAKAVDVRSQNGNNGLANSGALTQGEIDLMVQSGMDPNARNLNGQLPDEVQATYHPESGAKLNNQLKRHRSFEQHVFARHQMTAGMLVRSPFDEAEKFGDIEAIRGNPGVEWKGQQVGILSYIQQVHDDNKNSRVEQTIDTMVNLLSGAGMDNIFEAEGGARKALSIIVAVAGGKSGQQEFIASAPTLKKMLDLLIPAYHVDFQDVFLDAIESMEQPHISVFGNLLNEKTLDLMGASEQADEEVDAPRWAKLMPVLGESLLATDRTLSTVAPIAEPEYDTGGAVLEAVNRVIEQAVIPAQERPTWLQGLLPLAVMARRRYGAKECKDTLLERTVASWLGETGMPVLSEDSTERLNAQMRLVAPDFLSHSRQMHLEHKLPEQEPAAKANTPRF